MDFFGRQDHARRLTRRLVITFAIAVACIVLLLDLAAYGILLAMGDPISAAEQAPAVLAAVSLGTILLIALGSWVRTAQLSAGGRAVAESLGGRRVVAGTSDPAERVLLNVVEEMSIASGVPMPEVYTLDGEPGINAFAAGLTPGDAVVAVTRGCLDQLSRDELQGVIGHEFSHILNGDMRLNLRLIGVVHGILVLALAGRMVLGMLRHARFRSSRDGKGNGALLLILVIGVALLVVGSVGWFFAMLIKAAVSRQREFLADAAAVQFTRNPAGLAGALRRIAGLGEGSRVRHGKAEEASHLFFSPAVSSLFATHPPLAERIGALEGRAGEHIAHQMERAPRPAPAGLTAGLAGEAEAAPPARTALGSAPQPPATLVERIGTVQPEHVDRSRALLAALPARLRAATRDPFSAQALALALVCDPSPTVREPQLGLLARRAGDAVARAVGALLPELAVVDRQANLPLLHLCLPALRHLTDGQRREAVAIAEDLARRDGFVSLREFAVVRTLAHHLGPARPAPAIAAWDRLAGPLALLLSALAHAGPAQRAEQAFAAGVSALAVPGGLTFHAKASCDAPALERSLAVLEQAVPERKRQMVTAFARAAAEDGVVNAREEELLRLLCDCLDCPLPLA